MNLISGASSNLLRQASHLRSQTSDMARSRNAFTTARSSSRKRKGAPVVPTAGKDPEAFLRHVREQKSTEMEKAKPARRRGQQGSDNLNTSIRLVGALISTNEEIWSRCKESLCTSENDEQYNRPTFLRVSVGATIEVHSHPGSTLTFTTKPIAEQCDAFNLPQIKDIPKNLTSFFMVSTREDSTNMPDYEKLFHSLLLLEDDVLIPFLNVFKDHLEDVQVRLGQVETWLTESEACATFLKELFPGFEAPRADLSEEACDNCGYHFVDHPNDYCKMGRCTLSTGNITLKTVPKSDCGHQETFEITKEKGRTKLKKFLEYIS